MWYFQWYPGFSKGGGAKEGRYRNTLSILSTEKPSFMFKNLAKWGGAMAGVPYGKSVTDFQ